MESNHFTRFFSIKLYGTILITIITVLLSVSWVKYKTNINIYKTYLSSNTTHSRRWGTRLSVSEYLNMTHSQLISPNGQFILELEKDGNLKLKQTFQNREFDGKIKYWQRDIWWTSTGDSWPRIHQVILTSTGVLKVQLNDTTKNEWKDIWASTLLDGCDTKQSDNNGSAFLSLENSGALKIVNNTHVICVLNKDVYPEINSTSFSSSDRLAVIIAGLFRNLPRTCDNHMKKVVDKWPGKLVDIFVFTYLQDVRDLSGMPVTKENIENALRKCYGTHLKAVGIEDVTKIEEQYKAVGKEFENCGNKLHRLYSQVKTIYLAGQLMRRYMITYGITYEYVLRFRPDTNMWGRIPALPSIDFEQTKIYLIHPAGEHYYWCFSHDGNIRVGTSDQMAYGRLAAMNLYLNLYTVFPLMVSVVRGNDTTSIKMDFSGCTPNIDGKTCQNRDPCAMECIVNYWMVLSGLQPEVLWTWEQNLLR